MHVKELFVVENKKIMKKFMIIRIEQLEEIVTKPTKKDKEEKIISDIIKSSAFT